MRLLIKVGGAQLSQPEARGDLARSVASARARGHQIILVHGGGDQIRALSARLGIQDRYHQGLRITDADTAELVLATLGGTVNRQLVASLQEAGIQAVGLTGADGNTFSVRKYTLDGHDLGYVGKIERVDPALVEALLALGVIPVLATVAPLAVGEAGERDRFYNINADHACGPLAHAFGVDVVVFLTDVPGVLDAEKHLIPELDAAAVEALTEAGVIHGGMIPKVQSALEAWSAHPDGVVKIAPASGHDAVLQALTPEVGTRFVGPGTLVSHPRS